MNGSASTLGQEFLGNTMDGPLLRFIYLSSGVDSSSCLEKFTHHTGVTSVGCNDKCSVPQLVEVEGDTHMEVVINRGRPTFNYTIFSY